MIEELKRFIAVAKNKHITNTARELYITQSALTQSIQRLENELHTSLITYKGKQLQITPEGETVLVLGTKILSLWEKLHDEKIRAESKQVFAIGMFDNAALLLGDHFQKNKYASLFIELTIEASSLLFTKLQLGVLDMAICVLDPGKKLDAYSDIHCIAEFNEELYPVSAKKFSSPVGKIPFILYNKESHTRQQIDAVFTRKGITPTVSVASTSTTYMKELAKLGNGVALLPYNFISEEIKQKQLFLQKMPIKIYRKFGLFLHTTASEKEKKLANDIVLQLRKNLLTNLKYSHS